MYCKITPVKPDIPLEKIRDELNAKFGEVQRAEQVEPHELTIIFSKTQNLVNFIQMLYELKTPVNEFITSPDFKTDYPAFVIKIMNSHRDQQYGAPPPQRYRNHNPKHGGHFRNQPPMPPGAAGFGFPGGQQYTQRRPQGQQGHFPRQHDNFERKQQGENQLKIEDVPSLLANLEQFKQLERDARQRILYDLCQKKTRELNKKYPNQHASGQH